jgi:hypothetical protein
MIWNMRGQILLTALFIGRVTQFTCIARGLTYQCRTDFILGVEIWRSQWLYSQELFGARFL